MLSIMKIENNIGDTIMNQIWGKPWSRLNEISICKHILKRTKQNQCAAGLKGLLSTSIRLLKIISLRIFIPCYSGSNPIGSKGAELLSKADLPVLQ